MHIVKEFGISEVSGTLVESAPYKFTLRDPQSWLVEGKESSMAVGVDACARHGISLSLDLVGRTLICSFESHELPTKEDGQLNGWITELLGRDDVVIESLEKKEKMAILITAYPPVQGPRTSRILQLSTFSSGRFGTSSPCPFYHFFIELTEEEYEECKALPPYTVFWVSFSLKAVEVIEPAEQGAS